MGRIAGCGASQRFRVPHQSGHAWLRWVPEEYRARALTLIHASFSVGTVFGMLATPQLVLAFGWPGALKGFTLLGLAWVVSCPDLPSPGFTDL